MNSEANYQPIGPGPLEADTCPTCHRPYGFCACAVVARRILTWPVDQPTYLTAAKFSRFLQLNEAALRARFLSFPPEVRGDDFFEFSLVQHDLYGRP